MSDTPPLIELPGCKSVSQRALLLAAIAEGESELTGVSPCADSQHLQQSLAALGAQFTQKEDGALCVRGLGGPPRGEAELDVGEAGSSLRFLLPLCAAGWGRFRILGTRRLMERPHDPLLDCLRELGTRIERVERAGKVGFEVLATGLPDGEWPTPQGVSSQYLSGLVMASCWREEVSLQLPSNLPSRGYFDLTLQAMRDFCGERAVREQPHAQGSRLQLLAAAPRARSMQVPGDPSGATFFLVASAVLQQVLSITPTWTATHPEAELLRVLAAALGMTIAQDGVCTPAARWPEQRVEINLDPAPDAGPALAILGACLPQGILLHGIERLRAKESDRVAGMEKLAALLGGHCERRDSSMLIRRGEFPGSGGALDPDQDHRMAMAAGVAMRMNLRVHVTDPLCVAKSFPDFWRQLAKLP